MSVQLLAYADDRDFIARSQPSFKEAFLALESAARKMGLRINQEETKYMITSQNTNQSENTTIGNYKFEVVQIFTHLGSSVSCNNDISQEIEKIILRANK
jgi:hypothetical protein